MPYRQPSQSAAQPPAHRVTAADVHEVRFGKPPFGKRGYDETEVDDFLRQVADTLAQAPTGARLTAADVRDIEFRKPRLGSRGYDEDEVDAFLDHVEHELRWRATPAGQRELAAHTTLTAHPTQVGQPPQVGRPAAPQAVNGPANSPANGPANRVRAMAVAVLCDRGRMLATEQPDPETGQIVYRPPGADVAFGERGHETVVRAFREEFGIALVDVRAIATLESVHRFAGQQAHELVLVYEAAPADAAVWGQQRLLGQRGGMTTSAVWVPTDAFRRGEAVLLPEGLIDLLASLSGS